jgi:hypothetical protein
MTMTIGQKNLAVNLGVEGLPQIHFLASAGQYTPRCGNPAAFL